MINNWQKLVKLPVKELKILISTIIKSISPGSPVIGITFVDDKTIRELNKKYRKKDKSTDVLSFALNEAEISTDISSYLIGDVVISIETTLRQANAYKHSFQKELKTLLIHGILHLFGYDHIKQKDFVIMNNKEKEVYKLIDDFQLNLE